MLRARLTRADRWALAILVLVPVMLNVPWALAGHPVLDGDNLSQNYPLRVLVGQYLSHGHFPLWDPAIWSGVPLLAGWNAGAMFPGTWLFALLPGVAAYELNLVLAGVACGVGFHLFLRRSGCSPLASLLGALTWSEMGFVSGQAVHLGLVEGTALAPWMLLALDGLFRTARARAASGHWVALLGAAGGLAVLAGDPRAVSSDAIIAAVYLAARCWRERRQAARVLGGVATAGLLAVALSTVQWLPGLAYLHSSQRAASTLSLFGFYSLRLDNLPLLFTPYLIGGNGNLGMPSYAGPLNLPEVTYAVGILPLIALFALLPRLLGRRAEGYRSGLGVWYAMFLVGVVLTTGTTTPLGHLLVHIPLYGGQRDQNRNAAIADFALAVLLAIFVDGLRSWPAEAPDRVRTAAAWLNRWLVAIPVVVVIGLIAAMFVFTTPMEHWLRVRPVRPRLPGEMAGYYVAAVAIAIAGLVVAGSRAWRSTEIRRRAAAAVVVADTLLFVVMASYQPVPLSVLAPANPALTSLLAHLPPGSRVAIDDPNQLALTTPAFLADKLGVKDLVVLHLVDSVQGYGSAVPKAYDAATGTHNVENLLPTAFLGRTYDDLDLGIVAIVPEQFGTILPVGAPVPIPPGRPVPLGASPADVQPSGIARYPYPPSGPWRLGPAGVSWQLPAPAVLSSISIAFDRRYGPLPTDLVASVRLADGTTLSLSSRLSGTVAELRPPLAAAEEGGGVLSISVRAQVPGERQPVVAAVVVSAASAGAPLAISQPSVGTVRFVLDGNLQGLLAPPHWTYAGHVGPLVLYRDTRARGPAWLEAPAATAPAAPSPAGSVAVRNVAPWQDPVAVVDAPRPALLVRSEEYSPGWSATLQPMSASGTLGPALRRSVRAVGILQGVEVPAGRYLVTWHYRSTRAEIGLVLGAAGTLATAAMAFAGLTSRRRRLQAAEPQS